MTPITHLYWRAGFGLRPQDYLARQDWPLERALDEILTPAPVQLEPLPAMSYLGGKGTTLAMRDQLREQARQQMFAVNANWLLRMAKTETDVLRERMTLFWHGHFACESKIPFLAVQQINTIRQHALGNFRDLVLAISRDPSMIRYLNNQQNRKEQPNENFARELMELFTLGRGNYTEADVKAAARAFTGWASNREGAYSFRPRRHDFGRKTFMGKTGNWNGDDIIDMILEKPEAAQFIVRKIYRYFVHTQVDEDRVRVLAQEFYDSNYDIGQLMARILRSDWFYDPKLIGGKVKSPIELLIGYIRQFNLSDPQPWSLVGLQRALGQILLRPPNVAGWPGGLSWIDNSTLLLRLQLGSAILRSTVPDFAVKGEAEGFRSQRLRGLSAQADLEPLRQLGPDVDALARYLLPLPAQLNTRTRSLDFTTGLDYLLSLPEYQFC